MRDSHCLAVVLCSNPLRNSREPSCGIHIALQLYSAPTPYVTQGSPVAGFTLPCSCTLLQQNSLRYPIPVPLLHHHTSAIITDCNRSTTLFPWLDLPGFLSGTETKREVWLLRTGFGIAPVNKLVSLTWLLWALRSFRSFTLHYIT